MKKRRILLSAGLFFLLGLSACSLPGVGSNASFDTTPPVIRNLTASEQNVFYNDSSCGPTRLAISMDVSDDSGSISAVGLQYRYRADDNFGASLAWRNVSLPHVGNGHFAGELDVAAEAGAVLGHVSGALEYQVYAVDGAGNIQTMPATTAESLSVQYCNAGIASKPANTNSAPVAPPQPSSPNTSSNGGASAQSSSGAGSSGGSNNGSPSNGNNSNSSGNNNSSPSNGNNNGNSSGNNNGGSSGLPPAMTLPDIRYFTGPASVNAGELILLEWDVRDACKVFLDGNEVNSSDSYLYTAPLYDTVDTHYLVAWGSTCDASTETTAQVDVQIWASGGIFNPGGGSNNPPPTTVTPVIQFFTGPSDPVAPGDSYTLQWEVSDAACGVFLEGVQVNPSGTKVYVAPAATAPDTWTHNLDAKGEPCSNPTVVNKKFIVDIVPPSQIVSGFVSLYDQQSADLGDGGGDDVSLDLSSGDYLVGTGGTLLAVDLGGTSDCKAVINASSTARVTLTTNIKVCYKTGNGNYGDLYIYYDSRDDAKSDWWIEFAYDTEITP
ncbi:MAG: hypothetical protein GXP40_10590 [Chloroflexi bacterium]|nr:hypothetical protein [Chloroflexota bacterium]